MSAADNDLPIASPRSLRSCLNSAPVTWDFPWALAAQDGRRRNA
jgi:hypothetical protein